MCRSNSSVFVLKRFYRRLLIALLALWCLGCDSPTGPEEIEPDFFFEGEGPVVQFNDRSKGPVVTWEWDFGDGRRSNDRSPVHEFRPREFPETFIVRLTVCEAATSCRSTSRAIEIFELGPPA